MSVPASLSTITPIPSSTLSVTYRGKVFTVTLDSGATVSFISHKLFKMLKVPLYPNGQLAQLALPHIRAASLGEIDIVAIEASTNRVCLRLRALVMPELSVPCYGGRNFERDNGIVDNVNTMTVTLHDGRFTIDLSEKIGPLPSPKPPPSLTVQPAPTLSGLTQCQEKAVQVNFPLPPPMEPIPSTCSSLELSPAKSNPSPQPTKSCTPVLMKDKAHILPQGLYSIPCDHQQGSKVLVLPPSNQKSTQAGSLWPPKVCEVALGSALYVNDTEFPLYHDKNTHFRLVPMEEKPVTNPISCPVNLLGSSPSTQPHR